MSDALYAQVHQEFSDQAMVELTLAIIAINGWNRLSIGFRSQAGTYVPPGQAK